MRKYCCLFLLLFIYNHLCSQAKISLSKTELILDTLYYGQGAQDSLYIRSTGNEPLMISNISWGDGGVFVYSYPKEGQAINPGDSALIIAGILRRSGKSGSLCKQVRVSSNAGLVSCLIKAYIKSAAVLELEADTLHAGVIDTPYPQMLVHFINAGNLPLIISSVNGEGRAIAKNYPASPIQPGHCASFLFKAVLSPQKGPFRVALYINGNFRGGQKVVYMTGNKR